MVDLAWCLARSMTHEDFDLFRKMVAYPFHQKPQRHTLQVHKVANAASNSDVLA